MKKKWISILLTAAMTASLMAGCGNGTTADNGAGTEAADGAAADTEEGDGSEEDTTANENSSEEAVAHGRTAPSNGGPIEASYEAELPTDVEDADIYVEKIDGLPDDFIKGMDISSLLSEEESGVVYYNKDGEQEDLLKILADAGVNYVRVRVWNDPYDADGNGYGGGDCDAATAAIIGARAEEYGIKLCVDFHYSDFWADPNKQMTPKAWEGLDVDEKAEKLYEYTLESLNTIIDAGADVGMVQIGNEINYGIAGEVPLESKLTLLKAGSKAVREVAAEWNQDIRIAVHFTNIDNPDNILDIAGELADGELDYDVFGVSYYTYWHGTQENLVNVLSSVAETYGVETCVMETAYMYTGEDGDSSSNSVSEADEVEGYPCTVQGQANNVRDVMAATVEGGGIGVFYWEGAWVPVGSDYTTNQQYWENYGSGWASSYAAEYDPDDAGQYYGGSSWDNQALFDFTGKALASLDVFKYVNYGAVGTGLEVLGVEDVTLELGLGEELALPDTVSAYYNDSSCKEPVAVTWDADDVAAVDMDTAATYTVNGSTGDGTAVTATIKVSSINYVENPGFEDDDTSMWVVTEAAAGTTDIQNKSSDAYSGTKAFHFWSDSDVEFTVEQTISGVAAGTYSAVVNMQGGDVGTDAEFYLYVKVGDKVYTSENASLTGWVNWVTPTITGIEVDEACDVVIGVSAKCAAKGWGTIDDFEFFPSH
jgi:arabinogalactan endo-1,4-beta-galactosidase